MSGAVWITGLPGTGRSDVARIAVEALGAADHPVELLQLCELRRVVTPRPSRSATERELVYRALVYVASVLAEAGRPVVIDAAAPRRAWRDLARAAISRFAEVELTLQGELPPTDEPYEAALAPELVIDTTQEPARIAGARIANLVAAWPCAPRPPADAGCAVWLTGLPGSGKTTIASLAAQALTGHGAPVRIVDFVQVLGFVADRSWSPLAEDIAYRTLIYIAKRLSAAGVAVIVDATAPARTWRELARETIGRFAEVQLVCPRPICSGRERVVRWQLEGCSHRRAASVPAAGPDIAPAYEYALCPEVTIHTDVEDPWSAAETVLRLVLRVRAGGTELVA